MYKISEILGKIELPDICNSEGKEFFVDPVREKMILKTPEEVVRQRIVVTGIFINGYHREDSE